MLTPHVSSHPYFVSAHTEDDDIVIEWAVDQLWIDPDTNEQKVLADIYHERVKNERPIDSLS